MSKKISRITFGEWADNNFNILHKGVPLKSYEIDISDYMSERQSVNREKFKKALESAHQNETKSETDFFLIEVSKMIEFILNTDNLRAPDIESRREIQLSTVFEEEPVKTWIRDEHKKQREERAQKNENDFLSHLLEKAQLRAIRQPMNLHSRHDTSFLDYTIETNKKKTVAAVLGTSLSSITGSKKKDKTSVEQHADVQTQSMNNCI